MIHGTATTRSHSSQSHTTTRRRRAYVFLGPPMVGKGTQSKRISACCGFHFFEAGPMLKKLGEDTRGNSDYDALREATRKRELVPWRYLLEIFEPWLAGLPVDADIVLDGVPRNRGQRDDLMPILEMKGFEVIVIWFTTPVGVCMTRPARPGRHEDTNPELVRRGIEVFENETFPLLEEFGTYGICEAEGNLVLVDNSNWEPHQTAARLVAALKLPCTVSDLFPEAVLQAEDMVTG